MSPSYAEPAKHVGDRFPAELDEFFESLPHLEVLDSIGLG
jgi:hypothetical protein